jgi:8-oxo-dGTP pyrophosphatase MutT (NUDIX family)
MSSKPPESTRHAVCFLLMSKSGQVLAISRGDSHEWGLPGGKVEPNESLEVAVVREMFEETGYVVAAPQSVYTAFVPGETNFLCTTFIGHVVAQAPDAPRSLPFEGRVEWVDPAILTMSTPFPDYNKALFDHLNIRWAGAEVRAYVGQSDLPPDTRDRAEKDRRR